MNDRMAALIAQLGSLDNVVVALAVFTGGMAIIWYEIETMSFFKRWRSQVITVFWMFVIVAYLFLFLALTVFWPRG